MTEEASDTTRVPAASGGWTEATLACRTATFHPPWEQPQASCASPNQTNKPNQAKSHRQTAWNRTKPTLGSHVVLGIELRPPTC